VSCSVQVSPTPQEGSAPDTGSSPLAWHMFSTHEAESSTPAPAQHSTPSCPKFHLFVKIGLPLVLTSLIASSEPLDDLPSGSVIGLLDPSSHALNLFKEYPVDGYPVCSHLTDLILCLIQSVSNSAISPKVVIPSSVWYLQHPL
jgi:hypothetical protein